MALNPSDEALLAQYRTAYASLITGQMVAKVTSGGRTVEYSQADKGRLETEISRLQCAASGVGPRRGAVRFSL